MNRFLPFMLLLFFSCSSPAEERDISSKETDMAEFAESETQYDAADEEFLEAWEDQPDAAGEIAGEEIELEEVKWKQLGVPFPEDFVFKGIYGFNEGSVFLVGAGAVAYMFNGFDFENLGAPQSVEMLNAVWGLSPSLVWTGGIKGALLKYDGNDWTGSGFCKNKSDCIQTDNCLIPDCVNGTCLYSPSHVKGCCGFPSLEKDFDDGTLQGFTVKDIYEGVPNSGGIVWNVISHIDVQTNMPRYTSPPYALYFGIPDKPCYFDASKKCPDFDNGKTVGAVVVSETIKLPNGEKATLKFNVFIDAEQPNSYDLLKISVISGGIEKDVWDKGMVGGTTNKQFVSAEADISDYLGKEIKVSILFDSKDPIANQTEGVYIDDVIIETTCAEASSEKYETIYDIFGIAEDDIYAVGKLGQVLRYDGSGWKKLPLNSKTVFYGICSSDEAFYFTADHGRVFSYKEKNFDEIKTPVKETLYCCSLGKVFAGGGGTVLKYENGSFNAMSSSVSASVKSITTADGATFWAVGEGGLLLKIENGVEKFPTIGNGVNMHSIWARGAKEIFASGDSGVMVRYNGSFWITQKTPVKQPLIAVHGNAAGDTYAAGMVGTIIKLEGAQWIQEAVPLSVDLNGIFVLEDGTVYAAGAGGEILVRKEGIWKEVKSPTSNDLLFLSGGDGLLFAGGMNVISMFDGSKWKNIFSINTNDLRGVFALSSDNVIAVGDNGTIMRYDGFTWYQEEVEPIKLENGQEMKFAGNLYAIWGSDKANLLAVGSEGSVVRYDGAMWNLESTGSKKTLRAITGTKKERIWASGMEGTILHFNGKEWKKEKSGSIATLYDIFAVSEQAVYAVGDRGTVLQRGEISKSSIK